MSEKVQVAIRCRPLNSEEQKKKFKPVIQIQEQRNEIFLYNPKKDQTKQFTFDYAYGFESKQKDIYEDCAYSIVESVLQGYNGTIFAYGQTGTGKTFTMQGDQKNENFKGIIPRTFEQIFNTIQGTDHTEFLVSCTMLELYNEQVYDLLQKNGKGQKLEVHQSPCNGFFVKNLSTHDMQNDSQCLNMLEQGSQNRQIAETEMNKDSSRSHSIFTITVETSVKEENGEQLIRKGKLNLVDLAGSERQKKTKVQVGGKQMKEAQKINFSLVCLGKVISSLVKNVNGFIPYRDSKLTKLLMDSLGGNSKTIMIANIGPACDNYEETLQTLRYANQAKKIKNKPIINEDPKDAKLRQIQDEISKLKEYLKKMMGNQNINILEGDINENTKSQLLKQMFQEKEKQVEKFQIETEKIMQMNQLSEQEKKKLIEELKKNEQKENNERKQQQELLEKIAQIKNKIVQGDKKKEEFLKIQKELHKKREEQKMMKKEKLRLKKRAEDTEIEKGILEKKYASQKEELKEKERLFKKIENRLNEIQQQQEEYEESFNIDIKNLEEENLELEQRISMNEKIVSTYFDDKIINQINSQLFYSKLQEAYILKDNCSPEIKEFFETYVQMKDIQETKFNDINEYNQNLILFGDENPFASLLVFINIQIKMLNKTFIAQINQQFSPQRKIKLQDFKIIEKIGQGSFSNVYKVLKLDNGNYYAMKTIEKPSQNDINQQNIFDQFIKTWASLRHPNITCLYAILEDNRFYYLITEYGQYGNLFQYLKNKKVLSELKAAKFIQDIVRGVQYLHNLNPTVVHRDLKLENIIIHKNGLKICDFDQSKVVLDYRSTFCGTPDYLSPEMILNIGHDEKIDIWAIGIMFYEMLHGKAPFTPDLKLGKISGQQKLQNNVLSGYIEIKKSLSNEARDLILQLLKTNPSQRLNANNILNHPFFQKCKQQNFTKQHQNSDNQYQKLKLILNQSQQQNKSLQNSLNQLQQTLKQKQDQINILQRQIQTQNLTQKQSMQQLNNRDNILIDENQFKNINLTFLAIKTNKLLQNISNFFKQKFCQINYNDLLLQQYEKTINNIQLIFDDLKMEQQTIKKEFSQTSFDNRYIQQKPKYNQFNMNSNHHRTLSKNYNSNVFQGTQPVNNYYKNNYQNYRN